MKIAIILGTRPEIIKMSPVIRECERRSLDYFILHTGQHYSYEMDGAFFEELRLPTPKYNLGIGSGSHGEQTGRMLMGIEKVLLEENPDVVLVQGDTNTTLAGSLAASKLLIRLGHLEAGERSYDRAMPEEVNRTLADRMGDYLFVTSSPKVKNLLREGIPGNKIFVTGNTIVDAVLQNLEIALARKELLSNLGLKEKQYFLVTLHRQENVDSRQRLESILSGLALVYNKYSIPLVFAIHPRTRKMMADFSLSLSEGISPIPPPGFLDFLLLEKNARCILTDSGGVTMEACILRTPCVILRNTTELPEIIEMGSSVLAGSDSNRIVSCVESAVSRDTNWRNPFGDGTTALKTLQIIESELQ